ncbi:hypothetical protein ETI02_05170 [Macrococcoides canis]|nr:hypothetical protein ETI02_05170 [Macrococcus canis]
MFELYEEFIAELYGFQKLKDDIRNRYFNKYDNHYMTLYKYDDLYTLTIQNNSGGFSIENSDKDLSKLLTEGLDFIEMGVNDG